MNNTVSLKSMHCISHYEMYSYISVTQDEECVPVCVCLGEKEAVHVRV